MADVPIAPSGQGVHDRAHGGQDRQEKGRGQAGGKGAGKEQNAKGKGQQQKGQNQRGGGKGQDQRNGIGKKGDKGRRNQGRGK